MPVQSAHWTPVCGVGSMQPRIVTASPVRGPWLSGVGQEPAETASVDAGQLATTMVLRGAVGTLIGAAASPVGQEGVWGAVGFVMGATMGELGIVGVALAALWKKAG